MGFLDKVLRKKRITPDEWRRELLAYGRITDGVIIDTFVDSNGFEVALYSYTLNGVDFESSDNLTEDQQKERIKYAPGAKVGIRYDPKNQGNSVIE
ncbi:MAG TPA: hypothetical protein PLP07_12810 [Pyrinomonadaceae bacterium]|nr:hypothetical protein [Chloracidobacterium sp.]MBP9934669.1 hypothetical protein [Pyrinomonadaceae bacterium]MBK7804625.1 hypothetical protein [Chloracidobacterium sp.]MBK9439049.1 hypothetical protein [Chloracidobacterium sp.]MBK9769156.1 hypothetical protein [Chloracidobacterium sp.]